MKTITFYEGMANAVTLTLMYQGVDDPELQVVPDDSITRAMLSFGDYCLDTDEVGDADMIYFSDNNTRLILKAGLISSIVVGTYVGYLTLFDAVAVDGIAWQEFKVEVKEWDKCPVV